MYGRATFEQAPVNKFTPLREMGGSQRRAVAMTALPAAARVTRTRPSGQVAKRAFDIVVAATALVFFLPLIALFALLVFVTDPGPMFFGHMRVGRDGRLFRIWKIRSMAVNADEIFERALRENPALAREWAQFHKLRKDVRVTPVGRIIRMTSIDELPQLYNVLMGDMSIVGPRPVTQKEMLRYGRFSREYCAVRPGITGLWQVSGRSSTTYRRRVALDVSYVRNRTFWMDCWILLKTVPVIFLAKGSY